MNKNKTKTVKPILSPLPPPSNMPLPLLDEKVVKPPVPHFSFIIKVV